MNVITDATPAEIHTGSVRLASTLTVPPRARGIVVFAHGSGSSRMSPRNRFVAEVLQERGLATLLMDLLTEEEEELDRQSGHLRFDIPMLAARVEGAVSWLAEQADTAKLPVGVFGASTGAAAALTAAARMPDDIAAVVSRGGRPDLAEECLPEVRCPTLLIVGGRDYPVIEMNEDARRQMTAKTRMEIVAGATHLFQEAGALESVADLAADWFTEHLTAATTPDRTSENNRTSHAAAANPSGGAVDFIAAAAEPFDEIESADLSGLLDRIGESRIVLIGEATHGTSEFYRMRQRITRELIARHGFNIIAAEADWPDAQHLDTYVRRPEDGPDRLGAAFARFPTWMWRNHDVYHFFEWLRDFNDQVPADAQKAGFYGLDLYSLYASIDEVLRYLDDLDPELAAVARERYECLDPFRTDPAEYGRAVIAKRYRECQEDVAAMLSDLLQKSLEFARLNGESFLDASQNARVIANAERYYKLMFLGAPDSWNLRDSHMFETLKLLLHHHGPDAKAVVWAHNSHVGDAGATRMAARGETNIGRLVRESFRDASYTIGFGTHIGTVAAARTWGGKVKIQRVRPSHPDSYEHLCHGIDAPSFCLPLATEGTDSPLDDPRLERAIGVVYRPETELQSHYFEAVLPKQFDEYIWFDESHAVRPLDRAGAPDLPERHPFLLAD